MTCCYRKRTRVRAGDQKRAVARVKGNDMEQPSQSVRPSVTWRNPALPNRVLGYKYSVRVQLGKQYEVLERRDEQADWCVIMVPTVIDGGRRDASNAA